MRISAAKEKCVNCPEYKNCSESFASWVFFMIGLVATVAMRVVTVLMHLRPIYGKIAWYVGLGGFFLFFVYKFKVNRARARVIEERDLIERVRSKKDLTDTDYEAVSTLLCGLRSRKERINYFFIFALSAITLILALYLDIKAIN